MIDHCPPSVYPLSTWHHHMWLYLPGLPSPFLHNAGDPKLELRKAWEQGYVIIMHAALLLTLISFPDWGCCWRFRNLIITVYCAVISSPSPFLLFLFIPQFSLPPLPFAYSFPLSPLCFPPTFFPLPISHFLLIAERLSVRLIIMQVQWVLVGSCLRLCLYVCLSVTGLRLKYTGVWIVYVPFGTCHSGCHRVMAAWRSRSRTRRIEDDARTSPDVWKTVNCSTKGWKTTR